jgi:hypothetical protein
MPPGPSMPLAGEARHSGRTPAVAAPPAGVAGATAAGRVRALAKPSLDKLGERPSEPDLDNLFAPATSTKDGPK